MHPVFVVGYTAIIVLLCVTLIRISYRQSTSWDEKVALYFTSVVSAIALFYRLHPNDLQWLCLLVAVVVILRVNKGSVDGTPDGSSVSRAEEGDNRPLQQNQGSSSSDVTSTLSREVLVPGFSYKPLADGQIRLLKFSGARGNLPEDLQYELFHAKLSQRPEYVALSYSWGQSSPKEALTISVDGRCFKISRTLADALLKLKENSISTIWVDAICINQQDNIEKSREVTRMFAIYRTAQMVIVWLGVHTASERNMRHLVAAAEDIERPATRLHQHLDSHLNLLALEKLLSQPYFERVWIIQEVAAAKQARIFWGPYIFELRSLETLVRDRSVGNAGSPSSSGLAQRVLAVRAACRAQQKPRLMDILAMTTSSHTSVLRDKIYGLLGLTSDWTDFVQEPNYSEDVSEKQLSLDMTTNHIIWYSSADIIFIRSTSDRQSELPSWCPDYFHFQPHAFDKNLIPYICGRDVNLGWERRRAFGQGSPNMNEVVPDTFIVDGANLTLKGRCIGRIFTLGSLLDEEFVPSKSSKHIPTEDITDRDIGKAFRRLLLICHNQTLGLQPSSAFFSLLYTLPDHIFQEKGHMRVKHWLDLHKAIFEAFGMDLSPSSDDYAFIARRGGGLSPSTKILPEWREFFTLNEDNTISRRSKHPLHSMLQSISAVLDERMRLMYIHDQVLLGWAHRDARANDTVWHLEGCTLQAVLRKSEELSRLYDGQTVYQLVGHAYVDPVMASGVWMAKETRSRLVHLG